MLGKGSILILADKTLNLLNIDINDLDSSSTKKVYAHCTRCNEELFRERRACNKLHACPTHITKDNGQQLKWCNACKSYLTYIGFSKNAARADGLNSTCKTCKNATPSSIRHNKKQIQRRKTNFDVWLKSYISGKKSWCKRSRHNFELSKEQLTEIWEKQQGRCYHSGVKLEFGNGQASLYGAQLDRINSALGYAKDNVVWSSKAMNCLKGAANVNDLEKFVKAFRTSVVAEYQLISSNAKIPSRSRVSDAGFDLASIEDIVINPGDIVSVKTGLKIAVPHGWYYTIEGRSSLFKAGLFPCRGIIDAGYIGEVIVSLCNHSKAPYHICAEERIAQMILHKQYDAAFEEVIEFSREYSMRGEAGFGSSGRK